MRVTKVEWMSTVLRGEAEEGEVQRFTICHWSLTSEAADRHITYNFLHNIIVLHQVITALD